MTLTDYNSAVDQHADGIYRFAVKHLRDTDRAKDVVQESFARAWRRWDQLRDKSAPKPWLLKIVRNAIDMGPNGTDEPPVAVLQRILGEVGDAGGGGPTTGESLQTQLQGMLDFMQDSVEGLPVFIQRIKNRTVTPQPV